MISDTTTLLAACTKTVRGEAKSHIRKGTHNWRTPTEDGEGDWVDKSVVAMQLFALQLKIAILLAGIHTASPCSLSWLHWMMGASEIAVETERYAENA